MSRKIKTDYVLEVRGVRHHLIKEWGVGCGGCSLSEVCFNEFLDKKPCEVLANACEAHFEKAGDTI